MVTPVVETVKEKAAKIQEACNSDDEDVPLADQNLTITNVVSFISSSCSLPITCICTGNKEHEETTEKNYIEVREELDCELARRGLPSREKRIGTVDRYQL